jgi:alpha-glucosidase
MHEVLRFWLRRGVDGFRIDALGMVMKHPEMPDNPANSGWDGVREINSQEWLYNRDQDDVFEATRAIRAVMDEFEGSVTVGETFGDAALLSRYFGPQLDGLHLVFNFHFIERGEFATTPWQAGLIGQIAGEMTGEVPNGAQVAYAFGNHDRSRLASRWGEDGRGQERARAAALVLLALPGTPFIYYGEEVGMEDVRVPPELEQDPARFRYRGRDPARTPMPWDGSPGRGFSTGRPWLPYGASSINVADQAHDPTSLFSLYRHAIRVRAGEPALYSGGYRARALRGDGLLFERGLPGARPVLVAVNTGLEEVSFDLEADGFVVLAHTDPRAVGGRTGASLTLGPLAAAWLGAPA